MGRGSKLTFNLLIEQTFGAYHEAEEIGKIMWEAGHQMFWTEEVIGRFRPGYTFKTFMGLTIAPSRAIAPCQFCGHLVYAFPLQFKEDGETYYGINSACPDCIAAYDAKVYEGEKRAAESSAQMEIDAKEARIRKLQTEFEEKEVARYRAKAVIKAQYEPPNINAVTESQANERREQAKGSI